MSFTIFIMSSAKSLVIFVMTLAILNCRAQRNPPSVMFDDCKVLGKWDEYALNVAQFQSIPYSQPPLENLRWAPSVQISNYSDTNNVCQNSNLINATYYHSRCYQPFYAGWTPIGNYPPQSENCVHLDIYSPSFASSSSLPVLVYFHGGSSYTGGNFQYDFTNFSHSEQIVVVVPNYRLGLLGFLSFEALTNTSNTVPKQSGNYGLMDLKLSLIWIKQHITAFGGNPNDITISGQSTGGTVVLAMLAMPSVKGLFNRGISMSGSTNISMDLHTAEQQGQVLVDLFNCSSNNFDAAQIASCMRSIPAANLTDKYPQQWMDADVHNFGIPGPSKEGFNEAGLMIVDGYLVTHSLFDAVEHGLNDVPLMLGNTQYESDLAPYADVMNLTEVSFGEYLDQQFSEWGPGFGSNLWRKYYAAEWESGGSQLVYDGIGADATGFCGNKYVATIAADSAKYTSNIYLFSAAQWPSHPYQASAEWNSLYAFHSIDFQAATFSWESFEYWGCLPFEPEFSDIGFGQLLRNHWKNFILHDKPLDNWKAFNEDTSYSVALLGNGVNKYTEYNLTNSTADYKTDVCKYYLDNGIGPAFWWSN